MLTPTPATFRRRALLVAAAAFALALILWNVPQLDFIMYPFRLFVTFVHETGHGLAAIVSGGRFVGFRVFENGAGVATTIGGSATLILPAGYLGAALFGAALFYIAHTVRNSRLVSLALGVGLALVTILYTGLLTANFSFVAFFVGLVGAGLLVWLGRRGSQDANLLVLNLLAIITGLNALLDLLFLVGSSDARLGEIANDAAAFSQRVAPILPGGVWAAAWALLAVLMLGAAVYYSVIRRWRG
jgi:hypothetical protein